MRGKNVPLPYPEVLTFVCLSLLATFCVGMGHMCGNDSSVRQGSYAKERRAAFDRWAGCGSMPEFFRESGMSLCICVYTPCQIRTYVRIDLLPITSQVSSFEVALDLAGAAAEGLLKGGNNGGAEKGEAKEGLVTAVFIRAPAILEVCV